MYYPILDRTYIFWEDPKGLMYYFDKTKRNGVDKKKIREACPKNMHVYSTGITGSGDLAEVTDKAVEYGLELNNKLFHQLICVENNGTYSATEFDSKHNFFDTLILYYVFNIFRMSPELG